MSDEVIEFNKLTVTGVPFEMVQCERCKALMLSEDDMRVHADWHGLHMKANSMAALGFGSIGLIGGGPQL